MSPSRNAPVPRRGPVLLIEAPINPVTRSFGLSAIAQYPPLAQVRLAGQLAGEDVRIVDLRVPGEDRRLEALLRSEPPVLAGISATFTSNGDEAIRLAERVRMLSPGTVIVLGGTAASEDPPSFWESAADFIGVRKGDASLPALVAGLRRAGDVEDAPAGFLHRSAGTWVAGPAIDTPVLAALRPYAWRLLEPRHWRSYHQGFRATGMGQTSEGCPYDCNFCSVWKVHGRRVDVASLANVQHDLEAMPRWVTNFFFADDIWMQASETQRQELHDPLLEWMASEYLKRRPDVDLTVETRTDLFLRQEARFTEWIRRGGLAKIFFGIEAVTDEQLRAYSKRVSVDRNSDAIRRAAELGVYVVAQFVIPPDATRAYFDEIVRFLDAHRGLIRASNFTIATPLPGTELYHEVLGDNPELADRRTVRHEAFSLYTALMPTRLELPEFYDQVARVYRAARQVRVTAGGVSATWRMATRTPWVVPQMVRAGFALRRLTQGRTLLAVHRAVQGDRLAHPPQAPPARAASA